MELVVKLVSAMSAVGNGLIRVGGYVIRLGRLGLGDRRWSWAVIWYS